MVEEEQRTTEPPEWDVQADLKRLRFLIGCGIAIVVALISVVVLANYLMRQILQAYSDHAPQ